MPLRFPIGAVALFALAALLNACAPEQYALNEAVREGRHYVPVIVHPAFPTDSTAADSLTLRKQALWNDLEALMCTDELAGLAAAPDSAALADWLERFWRGRDPVATTDVNERRDDHAHRLELARRLYPSPRPPYYDARGRALVRFGEPDAVLRAGADVTGTSYEPPVEVWRVGDAILGFQSFANSGVFTPSGMPSAREGLFTALAGGVRESLVMLEQGELLVESDSVRVQLLRDGPRLWLASAVDCFRASDDSTRVRASYQLRGDQLTAVADSAGVLRWRYAVALALVDPSTQARWVTRDSVTLEVPQAGRGGPVSLSGWLELRVPAGRRDLTLQLGDAQGDGEQLARGAIDVPAFPADSLALSGIALSRADAPAGSAPGAEANLLGAPEPSAIYRRGMKLGLYNEVYGLETDRRDRHDCRLRYSIRARGARLPAVSSVFRDQARGSTALSTLIIDTATLAAGEYVLTLTVMDEQARLFAIGDERWQASRERVFRIVD